MKGILTFLFLFISMAAYPQVEPVDSSKFNIPWHPDYKLKWSDFQGKQPLKSANTGMYAGCAAGIMAQGYYEGDLKFKVTNNFYKLLSWATDTTSIILLGHEQIHFDIAEIYCRKIRKEIGDLDKKGEASVDDYTKLIQSLLDERDKYNSIYDSETKHGTNVRKQLEWREKTDKELVLLSAYYESNTIEVEKD